MLSSKASFLDMLLGRTHHGPYPRLIEPSSWIHSSFGATIFKIFVTSGRHSMWFVNQSPQCRHIRNSEPSSSIQSPLGASILHTCVGQDLCLGRSYASLGVLPQKQLCVVRRYPTLGVMPFQQLRLVRSCASLGVMHRQHLCSVRSYASLGVMPKKQLCVVRRYAWLGVMPHQQ